MDFFSKFKYTTKGAHALGGNNSNTISTKHRGEKSECHVTSLTAGTACYAYGTNNIY